MVCTCGFNMLKTWVLTALLLVLMTSWNHALGSQDTHDHTLAIYFPDEHNAKRRLLHPRVPRSVTGVPASPPSCDPHQINVTVSQATFPGLFRYTMRGNYLQACKDKIIKLYELPPNSSKNLVGIFEFQAAGDHCYQKKGLFQLEMEHVVSNNFSLPSFELRLDSFCFLNDSVAEAMFEKFPPWVNQLKLQLVNSSGTVVSSVIANKTPALIPGNYAVNNSYRLRYLPIAHKPQQSKCGSIRNTLFGGVHMYRNKQEMTEPLLAGNKTVLMLLTFLGMCCLFVGMMAVAIFVYHARMADKPTYLLSCYRNTTGTRNNSVSSNSPLIATTLATDKCQISPSVTDVLLVHAADTPELVQFCQKLKATIAECCNRKVLDITMRNMKKMESPETWLLQVLAQQDTTVLLVLSPALAALHRSLQATGERNTVGVNRRMQAWDNLLRECLHYLQDHLALNYTRLFIVARSQGSLTKDNIPHLVPGKRYLLPYHHQELLMTLGSCYV